MCHVCTGAVIMLSLLCYHFYASISFISNRSNHSIRRFNIFISFTKSRDNQPSASIFDTTMTYFSDLDDCIGIPKLVR